MAQHFDRDLGMNEIYTTKVVLHPLVAGLIIQYTVLTDASADKGRQTW
jgi:hypothetical protein